MLDDLFAADALAQRAIDLISDREAAEALDVMNDSDAIASVTLATVAMSKRLAIIGDQLAELTASIDRLALDGIRRDLHAERVARARIEGELGDIEEREQ